MRILLSNDDGIAAAGLEVLEAITQKLTKDYWVVAPETEQSGAGHSLSLHAPVRVREISKKRYAVSGTPTDCVLLALKEIIPAKQKIDLVLSGVNRGSNVGDDVTYSGTVAAAMEATNLEVPAIALSQLYDEKHEIYWDTAAHHAPAIIRKLVKHGWPKGVFINLNFPACTPKKVKGVRLCPQGKRIVNVNLTGRLDPKGRPYYWLGGERDNTADKPGVDVDLLHKGYITITPISMDMTDYNVLQAMQASLG
ncbi:MAG: 5'/3'-nucleotidase SurE [Rickettsiales bacterium]|jgi:5'-nucleotidase|nr:5'/3'-nucleotidase SurE [Rickettsiales bacterium]